MKLSVETPPEVTVVPVMVAPLITNDVPTGAPVMVTLSTDEPDRVSVVFRINEVE